MSVKDKIINEIIDREGGFVDDPDDSGGATNYGITEQVARSYGYGGNIRDLPKSLAFEIYTEKYWHEINGTFLEELSSRIAEEIADTAVNCGVHRAGTILQRCLNVLNRNKLIYPDLKVDGDIGANTLNALEKYLASREPEILLRALNCLQGAFYIKLAEKRVKDEKFIYGWLKNRVQL